MNIDLSKLKRGDEAVTKVGQILTFKRDSGDSHYPYLFENAQGGHHSYTRNGLFYVSGNPDNRDIVRVILKPRKKASKPKAKAIETFDASQKFVVMYYDGTVTKHAVMTAKEIQDHYDKGLKLATVNLVGEPVSMTVEEKKSYKITIKPRKKS